MLAWASAWADRLPAEQLALVFCSFFVGITWLGILLVHPVMRRVLHRNEPSNELVIHIAGTFALVYAVLLGLLTVATFQNTMSRTISAAKPPTCRRYTASPGRTRSRSVGN